MRLHSSRNGGFPSPCHTIYPEDALGLRIVCPAPDLAEEFGLSIGVESCAVFLNRRVKGRTLSNREVRKYCLVDGL